MVLYLPPKKTLHISLQGSTGPQAPQPNPPHFPHPPPVAVSALLCSSRIRPRCITVGSTRLGRASKIVEGPISSAAGTVDIAGNTVCRGATDEMCLVRLVVGGWWVSSYNSETCVFVNWDDEFLINMEK